MEAARILQLMRVCAVDVPVERLLAVGGGARNDFLLQLKATCFGLPIDRPVVEETSAMCAANAADLFSDLVNVVQAMESHPVHPFHPIAELASFYQ